MHWFFPKHVRLKNSTNFLFCFIENKFYFGEVKAVGRGFFSWERRKWSKLWHNAGFKKTKIMSNAAIVHVNNGSIEREGSIVYTAVHFNI